MDGARNRGKLHDREQEASPIQPGTGVGSQIPTIAIGQLGQSDNDKLVSEVEGLEVVLKFIHDQAEVVSGQSHQGLTGHLSSLETLRLQETREAPLVPSWFDQAQSASVP